MVKEVTSRVLCVCQGGRVRSVAMRKVLTDIYGIDALACGVEKNRPGTIRLLAGWADLILVPEDSIRRLVQDILTLTNPVIKTGIVNIKIGPDVWKNEGHPELVALVQEKLKSCMEVFTHEANTRNR